LQIAPDPHAARESRAVAHPVAAPAAQVFSFTPLDAPRHAETSDDGLLEYWRQLANRRWTIAAAGLAGLAVAAAISFFQPPVYRARLSLEVMGLPPRVEAVDGEGGLNPDSYVETQVGVLKSANLARRTEQVLLSKGMARQPQAGGLQAQVMRKLGMKTAEASGPAQLPELKLEVREVPRSRIIEMFADSSDAKYSSAFLNTLADQFIESGLEARWTMAERAGEWLNKQLLEVRNRMQVSEARLRDYTQRSGLLYTMPNQTVDHDRLRSIQGSLAGAEAVRMEKQAQYEMVKNVSVDSIPQVLDNGRLSGYQSRLAELRRELAELGATLTPEHYKVQRVQAQIDEVEKTFARERGAIVTKIKNEYESAVRNESLLRTSYGEQVGRVQDVSGKGVEYEALKRDVDSNRQLYDALSRKVREAGFSATAQATNIRILDASEPPSIPYKPEWSKNLALGLVTGLICGCLLVFASSYVNRSLQAPGETQMYLKVPELGVIPTHVPAGMIAPGVETRALPAPETVAAESAELATWQNRTSVTAESFRSALASILASRGRQGRPRVILVTSTQHAEGKSTTVSNLGLALAEINQKVLLIDADMRKPSLHSVFNVANSWGLSDLLRERMSLRDIPLEALVRTTGVDGLHLIPSGPGTVSIASLLHSARMAELIERVRHEFDTVLIDTPPMMYLADARVLGCLADGAILVIRSGKTTRDAAVAAKQRLTDDGITVLGSILNGWDLKKQNKAGYGAYPYPYGSES
jgi:capsular exopolysaccharide synthesis family protein